MEHEFIKPDEDQVGDFIDIVTLFNACTDKYLFDFPCDSSIINEENNDFWLNVKFKYPESYVEIGIIHRQKNIDNEKFELNMNDAKYIEFLSQYLRVAYDY